MSDMDHCCHNPQAKNARGPQTFTFLCAISAAALAGIGCLSCLPIVGAVLATSSAAALLDDHLFGVQIGLLMLSLAFTGVYFVRRQPKKWQAVLALTAYLTLFLNVLYFDNRTFAISSVVVLLVAHIWKGQAADPAFQILYFEGCPNLPLLKAALKESGIETFDEIDLEKLEDGHPLKSFSSPTLLFRNKPVIGARTSNGSLSCSLVTKAEMVAAIRKASPTPSSSRVQKP